MAHQVLCVCRDATLQRSRVWVLERAGLQVRAADTPEDGFALLSRQKFDLVVLGHSLIRGERLELLEAARAAGIAVIALRRSGHPVEPEFDASVDSTPGPEDLLAAVAALLNQRARAAGA